MEEMEIFDQLASRYRLHRRSKKLTKVIFYDLKEITTIYSFKLMVEWMAEHPGAIQRGRTYKGCEFCENLIQRLAGIELQKDPPLPKESKACRGEACAH